MAQDRDGSRNDDGDQNIIDSAEESDSATTTTTTNTNTSFDCSSASSDEEQEEEEEDAETRLDKLGNQHAILGGQLSQLLRDKAAAENIKKRLNDGLLRAKARIKAIEHKLEE
ncbi:hypothetical protein BGZ47_007276 [Haplosporangium gracile]|nr:hypothetical protein BGZ47_007276 [Haplosporangium gracile]